MRTHIATLAPRTPAVAGSFIHELCSIIDVLLVASNEPAARALPHPRSAPQAELPAAAARAGLGYRPLTAAQQRELRAQWLAARVILDDFAERRCCSREVVINVHVSLDELISILCAAVAFTDHEHLWRLAGRREVSFGKPG